MVIIERKSAFIPVKIMYINFMGFSIPTSWRVYNMITVVTRGKLLLGLIMIPLKKLYEYMEFVLIQKFYVYSVK